MLREIAGWIDEMLRQHVRQEELHHFIRMGRIMYAKTKDDSIYRITIEDVTEEMKQKGLFQKKV